ncbi:beta-hydroxyacyl-ACP dehydratase [Actinocrinis puniceicyclus]|uniref:Beta-hydroxyacyl-ACP dehydratase n=1 Tax=Actinocrinis puniceicyclus TaxID=977794 RepID=A0A8J8BBR1_9ACTN|nr:3-hydroxyacyl-ACP dehydratase FabZ family protein [Actinocrinis puniceicyclus]MBS2962346.1 beta-hydroxyacyl-ACP dehydratase [Actinocrinis puniceicyclus]
MTITQRTRATALGSEPGVREQDHRTLTAAYRVSAAEPVLEGHFPGFPIVPGVCLVECAESAGRQALAGAGHAPRLAAVESVRFIRPVYPGDEIGAQVTVEEPRPGVWVCRVRVTVAAARDPDGEPAHAAQVRLRYQAEQEPQ